MGEARVNVPPRPNDSRSDPNSQERYYQDLIGMKRLHKVIKYFLDKAKGVLTIAKKKPRLLTMRRVTNPPKDPAIHHSICQAGGI